MSSRKVDVHSIKPITGYHPVNLYDEDEYYIRDIKDPQHKGLVKWLSVLLASSILLLGAYAMVYSYFFLPPQNVQVKIDSLSVSPFNISIPNSQVTANWEIGLLIKNPNNAVTMECNGSSVVVLYKKNIVTMQNNTIKETMIEQYDMLLTTTAKAEGWSVDGIKEMVEAQEHGVVKFSLLVHMHIKVSASWAPLGEKYFLMRIDCRDVNVAFSSRLGPGHLTGESKECVVEYDFSKVGRQEELM